MTARFRPHFTMTRLDNPLPDLGNVRRIMARIRRAPQLEELVRSAKLAHHNPADRWTPIPESQIRRAAVTFMIGEPLPPPLRVIRVTVGEAARPSLRAVHLARVMGEARCQLGELRQVQPDRQRRALYNEGQLYALLSAVQPGRFGNNPFNGKRGQMASAHRGHLRQYVRGGGTGGQRVHDQAGVAFIVTRPDHHSTLASFHIWLPPFCYSQNGQWLVLSLGSDSPSVAEAGKGATLPGGGLAQ